MFTGIITDVGTVQLVTQRGDKSFKIATTYDPTSVDIGASISCSGACLTVVAKGGRAGEAWFSVDVSPETLEKTTADNWTVGTRINLERPLKVGEEIGGHIVSGHVDGIGEVLQVKRDGDHTRIVIRPPKPLAKFIAPKGSIALDGISLTVNEVDRETFGVSIIPHTSKVTTWGTLKPGDKVNIEIDMLARYLARLKEFA
jgi:riboflavin synthase